MELLLLEDIHGVGKKNDIIVVKNGFALNNLLPRRRALVATPTVRKRYADQIKRRAEERQKETQLARSAAAALKEIILSFTRKSTEKGTLYSSVSGADIAEALSEHHSIEIPEVDVVIAEPIKATGSHTVRIRLVDQEEVPMKVEVIAQ